MEMNHDVDKGHGRIEEAHRHGRRRHRMALSDPARHGTLTHPQAHGATPTSGVSVWMPSGGTDVKSSVDTKNKRLKSLVFI